MRTLVLLTALTLIAAALAGCATDAPVEGDVSDAPTTTTPADAPPAEEPPAEEAPLECPEPPTTDAAPGEKMGYPELVFTVQEPSEEDECFAFVGPATATAGWTAITLQNNGMIPHIMPMLRLDEGKTFEEFLEASAAGAPPEWAVPVGGVGFATPFSSGTVLMDLQEGTYVLYCLFEGHHMQGMIRPLVVTAAEGEPRPAPEADFTVTATDYAYEVPENLTAGTRVMKFVNAGTEPHEAPLVKLNEGVTMQDFLAAVENPQGPPPGAGVGGVNALAPGMEAYAIVDLAAGDYGFVCFVESHAHDGAPHVALGMVAQFSVAEAPADGGEAGGDQAEA